MACVKASLYLSLLYSLPKMHKKWHWKQANKLITYFFFSVSCLLSFHHTAQSDRSLPNSLLVKRETALCISENPWTADKLVTNCRARKVKALVRWEILNFIQDPQLRQDRVSLPATAQRPLRSRTYQGWGQQKTIQVALGIQMWSKWIH